jgi:hypothetical protein
MSLPRFPFDLQAAGGRTAPALAVRRLLPSALFPAALLLYAVNLDRAPNPDELYHILAARGLLETGEPRIAEGLYTRGYAFTWIVAQSFRLFGESLAAARLPSVVATALVAAVLFLWVRREAGAAAAWLAAGLYAVSPFAVLIAQFCRFYALQTLAFTLGLWLVHDLFRSRHDRNGLLWRALAAGGLFAFAAHLQPTTLIGLVALAAWAGPLLLWRLAASPALSGRTKSLLAPGLVLLAVAVLVVAQTGGLLTELWRQYREVPLFNAEYRNAFWFYHLWYVLFYPTLWPATGLLALVAWSRSPGLGSLATVVFAVAFLLNSFAGPKSLRYIAYAQPLLFVIWGIALAALWPALAGFAARLRDGLAGVLALPAPASRAAASALVALACLALAVVNPFWLRTVTVIADIPLPGEKPTTDWRRAADVLAPLLGQVDVVVVTEELAPLYLLGRADIVHSRSKLGELPADRQRDFGRDPRTGLPVIGSIDALERILRCYPSGLLLAPAYHLGVPHQLHREVVALLDSRAARLSLPEDAHAVAWFWHRDGAAVRAGECAPLPVFRR